MPRTHTHFASHSLQMATCAARTALGQNLAATAVNMGRTAVRRTMRLLVPCRVALCGKAALSSEDARTGKGAAAMSTRLGLTGHAAASSISYLRDKRRARPFGDEPLPRVARSGSSTNGLPV